MNEIHVGPRTERKNMQAVAVVLFIVILALAVYFAKSGTGSLNFGG